MGKQSAPQPPDPMDTARAQSAASQSTAMANNIMGMVNQITPYGNLTYSQSGQTFIPSETGQTYWQGPNGEIRSSAPQGGTATSRRIIGYERGHFGDTGDGMTSRPIYGDVTTSSPAEDWSKVRGSYIPQYTATQTLSPAQQQMLDLQNQAGINLGQIAANQSAAIRDHLSNPMSLDGLTPYADLPEAIDLNGQYSAVTGPKGIDLTDDYSADRQMYTDALMARLNPQLDRDRAAMEARLANQGIALGSRAYSAADADYSRAATDARLGAILAGGQEQQRMQDLARMNALAEFGSGLSAAQFAAGEQSRVGADRRADAQTEFNSGLSLAGLQNAQRGQQAAEQFALRNQPINEITALLSGSQVQNPSFVSPPVSTMPTTDVAGLINSAYGQQLAAWQQQQANANSLWGGLLGAGGMALGGWLGR